MTTKETLETIPFPECSKTCRAIRYFGVTECEAIRPHKFDKNGHPYNSITKIHEEE